ncbi:hypothetical protein ACRS6Y_17245 [Bacillus cytotoxicus]|uniref:hypothetical protein n=1 Tax=Bacillus cereus group TaxID=86661 RepID=UPI001AEE03C0|nr:MULTISPECIES: hypothetical protein [Bacillus cereus group]QTR72085.1 hypothetical protein JC775_05800 [Bacillus cytotoxicus]QTR77220.1 hypothetical protein JC773_11530 [Bacillus cytotoxicus]HDR4570975.1 hypothetical protein [Bacillus cytotoxicus]HDR4586787.1 hypothetical protein [Bacillus cytotoxicus]
MINMYIISNCIFIIDEFNDKYTDIKEKSKLKEIADTVFTEMDFVFRLASPFRNFANINANTTADIIVKSKDFAIEVKLFRNWKSKTGCANKMMWQTLQKDFDWLENAIREGKKGKRAIVLGWFNAVDRFSEIVQLGKGGGGWPEINEDRIRYFPFLNKRGVKTKDIFYMYNDAYKELRIPINGYGHDVINCMFLGKERDKFHIALYY